MGGPVKALARFGDLAISAALVLLFVAVSLLCLAVEAVGAAWRNKNR